MLYFFILKLLLVPWTCMAMRATISWCSFVHTWQAPSQQPVALQLVRCKYTQCTLCQSPCHSPPSLQAVFFWMPLKTGSTHLIPSVEGNFLTSQQKKSLSMRMWLLMNMDMQTPHGIARGWGLAAVVLCWIWNHFLFFQLICLAEEVILNCQTSHNQFFCLGNALHCMGQHCGMGVTTFVPFIIIICGTCMMVWVNIDERALASGLLHVCFMSHWDFNIL